MKWYAAHIVFKLVLKFDHQDRFPLMENIHLIKGQNDEDAFSKAEKIGRLGDDNDSNGTLTWNGKQAVWKFFGVRKLVEIRNSSSECDLIDDGTEATYQFFEFNDERLTFDFMNEETVTVKILE